LFRLEELVVAQGPVDGLVKNLDVGEEGELIGTARERSAECFDLFAERSHTGFEFGTVFRLDLDARLRDELDAEVIYDRGRGRLRFGLAFRRGGGRLREEQGR